MTLAFKIIFLLSALFMAVTSIGAKTDEMGSRNVALTAIFTAALVALTAFEMAYGGMG